MNNEQVMGGAVTLASCSKYYSAIKETLSARFLNEYFAADAAKLLSNSQDYFPRSAILNRNALTLATSLRKPAPSPPPLSLPFLFELPFPLLRFHHVY